MLLKLPTAHMTFSNIKQISLALPVNEVVFRILSTKWAYYYPVGEFAMLELAENVKEVSCPLHYCNCSASYADGLTWARLRKFWGGSPRRPRPECLCRRETSKCASIMWKGPKKLVIF
jgi:hypothetical protein